MPDDLLSAADLSDYPGAPFTEDVVAAAAAQIRSVAGWHIAPVRTETLTVDVARPTYVLRLPTLRLSSVTEIRDMTWDDPVILTDWRASPTGKIYIDAGWPVGYGVLEVDVVHGYESCPSELFPIIADYCLTATTAQDVTQASLGSRSETYGQTESTSDVDDTPRALAALSIAWGVA